MDSFWDGFEELFDVKNAAAKSYSPLVLAYIGDGIYDLVIRTYIVRQGNMPVNKINQKVRNYVKASAQKDLYFKIEEDLSEEEMSIFKRGRNAKSQTKAKNASLSDYRIATGVEALFGYLYLQKNINRLLELVAKGVSDE
jgi:ribonuclease-3 family protein